MAIISLSGYAGSGKDTAGKIIQWLTNTDKDCRKQFNGISIDTIKHWLEIEKEFPNYSGNSPWQIKKWAGPLRKIAAILLGIDEEFLYTDEFKQMVLPEEWNVVELNNTMYPTVTELTGRMFLQKLGTDAIRNGLHENAWVNALISEYKPICMYPSASSMLIDMIENPDDMVPDQYPNWIITDTRFPNELAAVKERGGITIRIERKFYSDDKLSSAEIKMLDMSKPHSSETALDNAQFDYVVENNSTIEELSDKLLTILKSNNYGHIND